MTTAAPPTIRRCIGCGLHKPPSDFSPRRRKCRVCRSEDDRARRTANTAPKGRRRRKEPDGRPTEDATWHQCSGADAHPAHRDTHRAGFWSEGHLPINFIEEFCVYPDDELQGQPVRLLPWQREFLFQLYRLRADGVRQYRRALLGIPKKNGKTLLAAWLGAYHTIADSEPSPFNVCAAASEDQADLVFDAAKNTCAHGPLAAMTERFEREILVPSKPGAKLRRVAVGGGNLDGPNLSVCILDELHEWRTPKSLTTFKVLSQGGARRRQPLFIMITTAGWDQDSLCYALYEHGKRVEADPSVEPTFLFVWYEAPRLDRRGKPYPLRSREAWEIGNPSHGVGGLTHPRFVEDCDAPQNTDADQRRYRLNQWTEGEDPWLAEGALEACRTETKPDADGVIRIELDPSRRIVAAIDASTKSDSTAIKVQEARGLGDDLRVRELSRIWERPIDPRSGQPQEGWTVPIEEVGWHLYSLHFGTDVETADWCENKRCRCGCGLETEPLGLESVGYDPAFITWEASKWALDGLPMIEIPQTNPRMVPGTKGLYTLIMDGRFEHDGNPVSERHFKAAHAKAVPGGGERLVKPTGSRRLIDGAIASVMCAYLLLQAAEDSEKPTASVYVFDEEDDA